MKRPLQKMNLFGVLMLAVLCVFQWRENRRLHLAQDQLEKTGIAQTAKLAEREQAVKNTTADLESFREQLTHSLAERKDADAKVAAAENQLRQLTAELEALKTSVTNWSDAVAARDEQIKRANVELQKLGNERNQAVVKFNELAAKYNAMVKDLNEARNPKK